MILVGNIWYGISLSTEMTRLIEARSFGPRCIVKWLPSHQIHQYQPSHHLINCLGKVWISYNNDTTIHTSNVYSSGRGDAFHFSHFSPSNVCFFVSLKYMIDFCRIAYSVQFWLTLDRSNVAVFVARYSNSTFCASVLSAVFTILKYKIHPHESLQFFYTK